MKKQLILGASMVCISLFISCSGDKEPKATNDTRTKEDTTTKSTAPTETLRSIEGNCFTWKGSLGNKIPLSLWFSEKGDLVTGEVTYEKSGKPIPLAGKKEESGYYVAYEFDKSGNITGIFSFQVKKDSLTGDWFSPMRGGNYDFKAIRSSGKTIDIDSLFAPNPIGEFRYSYGKDKGFGTFSLEDIMQDVVVLDLNSVTGAPAYHLAIIEDDTMEFDLGGRAPVLNYKPEDMECEFNITFFNKYASIDYVDNKTDCGFGYNAHPTGVYYKTK